MKRKVIGIISSIIVLFFTAIPYYENLYASLESNNIRISKQTEHKNEENNNTSNNTEDDKIGITEIPEDVNLKLSAHSAALMDASNGRVLYEKDGYKEMPMASTTKIMTCIIALENANLEDVVSVSKYASQMPDVQLTIREGEQYILKDLLYSLMLESHNDVAVAIAEHVGGSVEGFADMMNKKAKELGCEHTNFVTPNGLDANGHYTTAVELAKIACYAINNKDFINITNTTTWQFNELKKGRSFTVNNKDRFLYMYDGAIGVKTGFTGKAGYCFVGAVKKNDKTFISSVLASGWPPNKNYKWRDTIKLMDYGMDNFEYKQIFNADKKFDPVYVEDGQEPYVNLYYEGDISLLVGKNEVIKVVYKIPKVMRAPISEDAIVGNALYYVGNQLVDEVPIKTAGSVKKIDFPFCIKKIRDLWLIK